MPFLTSRSVVLAKIEGAEKTNAVPTGAANAVLTIGTPVFTENAEEVNRDIVSVSLSKFGFVVGISSGELAFTTELKGPAHSVSAASPLREDPLFRACGYSPTYGALSARYDPYTAIGTASVSATATLYAHIDGTLHILRGCRGSFDVAFEDGQFPKINWRFMGLYDELTLSTTAGEIIDATMATPTYDALAVVPEPVLGAAFNVHGYSACVQALTINCNNNVQPRLCYTASRGIDGFAITDREVTGTMNPEAVPRATHDFWYKHQSAAQASMFLEVAGTAEWTTVRIDSPAVQYRVPRWSDRNGIRTFDIDLMLVRSTSAGDDEFSITFKR